MPNLAMLSVVLDAQTAIFNRKVDESANLLQRKIDTSARAAANSINGLQVSYTSSASKIEAATKGIANQFSAAQASVMRFAAGFVGIAGFTRFTSGVVDASNAMVGFRQSLTASLGSEKAAADALSFLRAETGRLGTSLEASAEQFSKLTAATRGTSLEGEQTRKLFTAMSEASRVLNLSVDQTQGAFRAFEQMVSKGKVQAEELRGQLGERLPGAFRLSAEALGVTTAELDKMLKAGEVTAEDLLPKLTNRIHELYGAAATNAANSPAAEFERLRNSVFELQSAIGDAGFMRALASGASSLASSLTSITKSGALDSIVSGIGQLAMVATTVFAGRALQGIQSYAAGLVNAAAAQSGMLEMERLAAAAALESAKTRAIDLEQTLAVTAAARQQVLAKKALVEAEMAGAAAHLEAAKAAGVQSFALKEQAVASERLAAAQLRQRAVVTELAALGAAQARLQSDLANAATAQIAAQGRVAAALTGTQYAMQQFAKLGKSLFAMVGGWPTVILAAAYGLYKLWDAMKEGDRQAQSSIDTLAKYNEQIKENARLQEIQRSFGVDGGQARGIAAFQDAARAAADLREQIEQANQRIRELSASTREGADGAILAMSARIETLEGQLREANARTTEFASSFDNLPPALQGAITAAQEAGDTFLRMFNIMDRAPNAAATATDAVSKFSEDTLKFIAQMNKQAETVGLSSSAMILYEASVKAAAAGTREEAEAIVLAANAAANAVAAHERDSEAKKAAASGAKDYAREQKNAAKAAREAAEEMERFVTETSRMAAEMSGPLAQAQQDYVDGVLDAQKALNAGHISIDQFIQRQKLLEQQLGRTTADLAEQGDIVGRLNREYSSRAGLIGLTDRQREIKSAVDEATKAFEENTKAGIANAQTIEQVQAAAAKLAGDEYDLSDYWKRTTEQAEKYASIVRGAFDSMVDATAEWAVNGFKNAKEFWKGMVDLVKRAVAQMLAEWLKTKIIGMFTGQGGGSGWGAIAAGAMGVVGMGSSGNASAGGSATEAATQAALNFATGGSGSGMSLLNPSSWVTAGKNLYSGFQTAWYGSGQTTQLGSYMGTAQYGPGMATTYTPSAFGTALGVAGGVYAGYNRWQGSNKDFGGAVGAAAYGIGTVGAIGAVGGMMAGAGAAAGMAGGMASIGLAAIPVIGWIALAAMAVDMLSGGKLFGTKGKLHHSNLSMDVGAAGVELAQSYTLKGQKAFFGGTKWTTKGVAPSAEAMAAAEEFYAALSKSREEFAKSFNAEVGSLVGGTWAAEFDKKGNLTKSSSTVFGVTYEDETQEQFGQRLVAENMLDVLKQFDEEFVAMAEPYRQAVESLEQFANAAAMAQSALMAGAEMLALGADQSLSAFVRLAEGMQQGNETIDQTVQRLLQAQAQYDQFVAQFAEPVTYVDDFQAALANIQAQMQANMDQANALARAAGAEGAATEDLIRIHEYAAKQFAQALRQLEASAQDLAFNLGLTNVGSYDAITAEIERLQGKLGDGAGAVRDFGSAMQTAAQRASDAINLLLGDLSPLNDQQKLQEALGGLRAGTVTQEQVLQIGRRLYASTDAYNQLFEMVQGMGGRTAAAFSGGGRGSSGASGGLSAAESKRLQELLEQQQQMQAAMQLQQYQTLAQQIAEASMAREIDWQTWVADRQIDVQGLMEGLGLQSEEELDSYMDAIEAQRDSNDENTASIVDELQSIRRLLDLILNGRSDSGVDGSGRDGRMTEGSSRRRLTDEDAEAVGSAVGRAISGSTPRNGRTAPGAGPRGR